MDAKRYSTEDLDYAIRLLSRTEFTHTSEEIQWLSDPEHQALYQSLRATREAVMSKDAGTVDVKKAWLQFNERHKVVSTQLHRNSFWWGAVAATVALLFAFSFLYIYDNHSPSKSVLVYSATPEQSGIILQTSSGHSLELSSQESLKELKENYAIEAQSDSLNYKSNTSQKTTAEVHTLSTPQGKNIKVVLSDGTEVWLNAESRLQYPNHFVGEKREVELDGEAYFQVAHNKEHPFIVKTKTAITCVLGTEFNFKAYGYANTHVTLIDGSVVVTEPVSHLEIVLHPGEDVEIDNQQKVTVNTVDTRCFTAWREGYFYFKDVELGEIMRSIGRWYNLTVEFKDLADTHLHFNFWARKGSGVEETLQLLNEIGKVKAELNDNKIIVK